eukprot:COSAG01_NODE_2286_length_7990_cov_5.551895_2_plen_56_part_00
MPDGIVRYMPTRTMPEWVYYAIEQLDLAAQASQHDNQEAAAQESDVGGFTMESSE